MKYVMTIEVNARSVLDEETTQYYESLTPEQREERVAEVKADTQQMFLREMDDNAEVDVNVRVEEVAE
ncbi:hypothetical protein [Paenibacillus abyssi]|uniref:Uncharacterized protein n=1 Tax=Paenibacillus abyssi TaxID=1340531 RepID=A0A917FKL9_9BACL|nr:hypothetical protein [Paenibacillus abyssi]GGF88267.1 hypothetical protein GCM10010916_01970 [Paenibacillus abyssi]